MPAANKCHSEMFDLSFNASHATSRHDESFCVDIVVITSGICTYRNVRHVDNYVTLSAVRTNYAA